MLINKKIFIFAAIILAVSMVSIYASKSNIAKEEVKGASFSNQASKDYFYYKGEENKDALSLLKNKASIKQDKSGMVSSINERTADSSKHEYWAFYVNGKLASVGPADYITKDKDKIEWKIEKY